MLNDCNAKLAGQNEGDSGIYENTYTYAYGRQRAGRGKSSPCCPLFPLGAVGIPTVLSEIILKQFLPATCVLPAVLLLVQPVESSVQYKTVELHQKRRVLV